MLTFAIHPMLVITPVFVGVIVVGIIASQVMERKRTQRFEAVGNELGLSFVKEDGALLSGAIGRCAIFQKGRARRARNILTGAVEDLEIRLFDYRYTTGSGKNSSTHAQTIAAFGMSTSAAAVLPAFELGPERFVHRIAEKFGMKDIDFDEHPVFSKKFRLNGDNEAAVRAAFTPELREFFEAEEPVNIVSIGSWLLVYRQGKRVKPHRLVAFFDRAFMVCNAVTVPGALGGGGADDEERGMFDLADDDVGAFRP